MPLTFTDLYGAPPDPLYLAFRDGVLKSNDDVADAYRWRWSPVRRRWATFAVKAWILDDIAIPDTSPGSSFGLIRNNDPDVESARADTWLPPLFKQVQAAYARYERRWPDLVWSWHGGGDWRVALERSPTNGGHNGDDTTYGDEFYRRLPPECRQRIDDVRRYAAQGDVTAAVAQQLIAKIVEDCTVGRQGT